MLTDILSPPMFEGADRKKVEYSHNLYKPLFTVSRVDREKLNGHAAKVIWLTGLSGSGKSTIANALENRLYSLGRRSYILDGDYVRSGLNKDLGFDGASRTENIRRVSEVAKIMLDAGLITITSFISPFQKEREMAKELIGAENFIEIFISTPIDVCEKRDTKGLYKKARSGQLSNLTGIGSPYEVLVDPTAIIDCSVVSVEAGVDIILDLLEAKCGA